ncbi:alginate export family protein [Sessilibacter sp. MAH4]
MKHLKQSLITLAVCAATTSSFSVNADVLTEMLEGAKLYGDFRLRYESVDQDNALDDASALTLRSRIGFKTAEVNHFSATAEIEDSRVVLGEDDFSVPQTGFNTGEFSVVADPEVTELDQAFVQYGTETLTAKLGRQVFVLDGQRFIGDVGWRQDRQTFDALSVAYNPTKEITVTGAYLDKRNRIFADDADIDSKDFIGNVSFKTAIGKVVGYSYLLENEENDTELDTYGISLDGSAVINEKAKFLYHAEFATQETDTDFDADYLFLEAGVKVANITAKIGYELLGSDDGQYGFSTPLATLHKFNGWADIFLNTPATGLEDTYLSLSAKVGPGNATVVYHEFDTDEDTAAISDLGSELDLQYAFKFGKKYSAGIKAAFYSADDVAVDTDKVWIWVSKAF